MLKPYGVNILACFLKLICHVFTSNIFKVNHLKVKITSNLSKLYNAEQPNVFISENYTNVKPLDYATVIGIVKMGNTAIRVGIEPRSLAFRACVLTITPPMLPDVTILTTSYLSLLILA